MPTPKTRKRMTSATKAGEKVTKKADQEGITAPTTAANSPTASKKEKATGEVTEKSDVKAEAGSPTKGQTSDVKKDATDASTKPVVVTDHPKADKSPEGSAPSKTEGPSRYTGWIQWFWVKRGRGMITSSEVKGDLEVTTDSFKDSGGKEFWYPTADDEVTFELSLKGGKFIPTNVQVTKYHHFPGGPKALEKLIAAGKIAAPRETTQAAAESKEQKKPAKKGEKINGESEKRKISVIPLEMSPHGKAAKASRKGSGKMPEPLQFTRKLSKDAPEFIPHAQMSPGGMYTAGEENGAAVATPHGDHLETDYWAEAARKVSSTSLHVSESDSLPITYAQLLHLQDFYEAIKHAEAMSQRKGAPREAMPPPMVTTTPGSAVMV